MAALVVLVVAGVASAASSAPARPYGVAVEGSLSRTIEVDGKEENGCRESDLTSTRMLTFRSTEPARVAVVSRIAPNRPVRYRGRLLEGISGEISSSGSTRVDTVCADGRRATTIIDYPPPRRWQNGRLELFTGRRAHVGLAPANGIPHEQLRATCAGTAGTAFPALSSVVGSIAEERLLKRTTTRVVGRTSLRKVTPGNGCRIIDRIDWTITFTRRSA